MRPTGLQVEPIRVSDRSRGPIAASVAAVLAAFVAVAIAKPWLAERPPMRALPSVPSVARAAVPEVPPESPSAEGGLPVTLSGDSWDAVGSAVRSLELHSGVWGAGTASWTKPTAAWSDWIAVRARPAETPGPSRRLATSACRDAQLRGSSDVLAVTGPPAMLEDVGVDVWRLRSTPYQVRTGVAVEASPTTPGVVFLVPPPGESWPDGAYRFILEWSTRPPVELDVCVGPLGRQRLPVH